MSKYIILTNIGNRNLKYLNHGYSDDLIPKGVFYEKTKFIWENQGEFSHIHPQILPAILKEYPDCKLIMFTSHQNPPFQDTYYEGLILQELLKRDFPNVEIEALEMKDINPTKEDDLASWFRNKINYFKHVFPGSKFVIYNTGGTPQQKNALKAVAEFYLNAETGSDTVKLPSYKIYQGIEIENGETRIEEVKKTTIEELNQLTNVKLLIQHFNYNGALQLGNAVLNKNVKKILEYTNLRWNGMWQEIDKRFSKDSFNKGLKSKDKFKVIESGFVIHPGIEDKKNNVLLFQEYFRVCMTLISKAFDQGQIADYTGSILTLHQFIESFTGAFIESNSEFKIVSDRRHTEKPFITHLLDNYKIELTGLFGILPSYLSLPLLLYFSEKIAESLKLTVVTKVIEEFKDTQSFFNSSMYPQNSRLDTLRNGIAHEGKGVDIKTYQIYSPLIDKCYKLFIEDGDVFGQLNSFIEDLI